MERKDSDSAVVVLSGGQDSVTCLGVAMKQHSKVYAIGFNYGQRHVVELACAQTVATKHAIPFKIVTLDFLQTLVTSALTGEGDVSASHPHKKNLPASFVPNRNALFLTLAHAYAQEVGANTIYTGVCQTDYSGYPDCREGFIYSLRYALNRGYEAEIEIRTPIMHINKAQTFALAELMGILDDVVMHSHTCYEGKRDKFHDWGYGCGECPACKLRANGWEEYIND